MPEIMINPSRLSPGDSFPPLQFHSTRDEIVAVPDPTQVVHLQFRRFAGCPVCSLHLREFIRRQRELETRGIREVVLFHATPDALRTHHAGIPFDLVADPDRRFYRKFGVEPSLKSVLHPAVWWPAIKGVFARGVALPETTAGGLGLPADVLIAPDGRVIASHYGRHADDQWSFDEVLALTARCEATPAAAS
jgi:peroxiredoxin